MIRYYRDISISPRGQWRECLSEGTWQLLLQRNRATQRDEGCDMYELREVTSYKKRLGIAVRNATWFDHSAVRKAHEAHVADFQKSGRAFTCECVGLWIMIETYLLHKSGHLNTAKARQERAAQRRNENA